MIFMITPLTCCKTHQSVTEKSTVIAKDTMAISRVAAKDSTFLNAKIDSIIIEEYAVDEQGIEQTTEGHNKPSNKVSSCRKGNHTSQKATKPLKKKTKIYGANISGNWVSANCTLNKKMTHQQTTNSEVKQTTPAKDIVGGDNVYAIAVIMIALFIGYLIWKIAVQ